MGVRVGSREQGSKKTYLKDRNGSRRTRRVASYLSNEELQKAIESARPRNMVKLQVVLESRVQPKSEVV